MVVISIVIKCILLYECRAYSFKYTSDKINFWKSSGLNNYAKNSHMDAVSVTDSDLPSLVDNGRMSVALDGAYFKQRKSVRPNSNNVINIYCVHSLDHITNLRNTDYTVQNLLFGGVKITKNTTDTSKHKYERYGICFDEGGTFSKGGINNGRNVITFGVHEDSNKANNIYVMGDFVVQGINGTTLYAEKIYSQSFTAPDKKFMLSLHYNGDSSYLFVNGKHKLKPKAKDDQIVKEILCLGNISDDGTHVNARKTGFYGNIYDFAVDYTNASVGDIYNVHRYLMKKNEIFVHICEMLLINLAISLFNTLKENALQCMSVVNQKCIPRPKIVDVNANEPYSVLVNKCSGSCKDINDPFAKLCVPDIAKNVNMKVYNLLSRDNGTKNVIWHETCKCVCRLTSAVSNSRQIWNSDTCTCECNDDFADKIDCKEEYMWNPSTCACECDLWCKQGQYLDYKNCVCKNKLIGKVYASRSSFINENMTKVDKNGKIVNKDSSFNIYAVLFSLTMLILVAGFGIFAYRRWFKNKKWFSGIFTKKLKIKISLM